MICPNCRTTNPGTLFCFNCQTALPTSSRPNNSSGNQNTSPFSIADLLQATENDFLAATAKTAQPRATSATSDYSSFPAPNFGTINQGWQLPPHSGNALPYAPNQFNYNSNQYAPPFANSRPFDVPLTDDHIHFRDQQGRTTIYKLAGFFRRFTGAVIDGILMAVLSFAIGLALLILGGDAITAGFRAFQVGAVIATVFLIFLAIILVGWVLPFCYHVFRVSVYGQTLGHRIMGIEVISTTGKRPGFGQAFIRALYGMLPAFVFFLPGAGGMNLYNLASFIIILGMLVSLFDKHKQGLHDKLAGTYVVVTPR